MAFWGIYVKPDEPYILKPGGGRRLRISQATLGEQCEATTPRSVVKCVVGNKPAISICSLSMIERHCCHLDLQFEEHEYVVFSVDGPKGVHLSGYYLAPCPTVIMGTGCTAIDDFTIGFHNNNNPNIKEAEICKEKKVTTSEEDIGDTDSFVGGSDDENDYDLSDSFIDDTASKSSVQKHPGVGVNGKIIEGEKPKKRKTRATTSKRNLLCDFGGKTSSRKKNAMSRNRRTEKNEASAAGKMAASKRKSSSTVGNGSRDKPDDVTTNGGLESEMNAENSMGHKRIRKFSSKDVKSSNGLIQNVAHEAQTKNDNMHENILDGNIHHQRRAVNGNVEKNAGINADTSDEMKLKKRKKRKRTEEKEENVTSKSVKKLRDKNVDAELSEARTLSNGIIVEELATGEPGGKIAVPGSKVKIMYTARSKETGEVIDSNSGQSPIKFRLGDEEIIKGWNVGIEGMRVGDKRRLILSPSMGTWGKVETDAPSNSWLVYDVELISVR